MTPRHAGHAFMDVATKIDELVKAIDEIAQNHECSLRKADGGNLDTTHSICHMVDDAVEVMLRTKVTLSMIGLKLRNEQHEIGDLAEKDAVQDTIMKLLHGQMEGFFVSSKSDSSDNPIPHWRTLHRQLIDEMEEKETTKEVRESSSVDPDGPCLIPGLDEMLKLLKITPPEEGKK